MWMLLASCAYDPNNPGATCNDTNEVAVTVTAIVLIVLAAVAVGVLGFIAKRLWSSRAKAAPDEPT
jgi:hypothetical protein